MVAAQAKSKKAKAEAVPKDSEIRPPEEFVSRQLESVPKPPAGLYPEGAELFSYTVKATGETIWFPMKFEQPNFTQTWEVYDKPWYVQTWEYMKWANVPRLIQRQAVQLFDKAPDEYLELFNKWMEAVGGAKLGE